MISKSLKLDISPDMTVSEIREVARKNKNNGSYATHICRKCGMYWVDEDGDCETAIIQDGCKKCSLPDFPAVQE